MLNRVKKRIFSPVKITFEIIQILNISFLFILSGTIEAGVTPLFFFEI